MIKLSFSKLILIVSFILNVVFAQAQSSLVKKELFKMDNILKGDTRAVFVKDDYTITGGVEARINFKILNDSLPGNGLGLSDEDYRDLYCFDFLDCIFMNSGKAGKIVSMDLEHGQKVRLDTNGVFLNSMDFWNDSIGIVMGDPIQGKFFISKTTNGGKDWFTPENLEMPKLLNNEVGFAASGTTIKCINDSIVYFGTGGSKTARLFKSTDQGESWIALNTPMKSGENFGVFSIDFWNENEGIIIGGSYIDTTYSNKICYYTKDGGETWINRSNGLPGYCSSIVSNLNGKLQVTTGRLGTYYTLDKGEKWQLFTNEPYFSIGVSETYIVFTGRLGKFAAYNYSIKE